MAKIVLFVDALEPRETGGTFLKETERGLVKSGAPKVTPKVTSEVYTGQTPSQNGFGGQHSIDGERRLRPQIPTIQEKLDRAGYEVLSLYLPYCHPLQIQNNAFVSETMQGPQPGQSPIAQMALLPPAPGELLDSEDDGENAFNARTDEIYMRSSLLLNLLRTGEFDVAFIAIRSPDQYTHFQWHEDYRRKLLEDIAYEIQRWEVNHDILWFSDHGSEEKKEVFRINKWLIDKGYLDLDVDIEFNERFSDEMERMQPNRGTEQDVENQINIQGPGVDINDSSQALSADPYDSSIDVLDDKLDVDTLISELRDTDMYQRVVRTEDEWGDGPYIDSSPDIVTLRDDNVLVSGNVHPDPIGMGFYRTGVHSKYGAWGTTDDSLLREGNVKPTILHDIIWEFVTESTQVEQEVQQQIDNIEQTLNNLLD